ncbi:type VI secretion system baseplate subunit TssE [Paraburkholderia sp. J67]|uniref:type VI secretion system baseplate subunit TssE n=1 Tax=Paraburkholderia sp. J67 TaxID=2805435 RepID=UPI002ABD1404|nr:type VI secretion system baseplate subunit TssE [Paraburkholderia sp. J67]
MRRRKHDVTPSTDTPRRQSGYLMPTLLDRLADSAPHRQHEAPGEYAVTRNQMRDIIQRDLAYLLNTTNLGETLDSGQFPLVAKSTINYGVPPLAGSHVATRKWEDIQREVRQAILNFEYRLIPGELVIERLEGEEDGHYGNLSFEIRGMIRMDPYPLEFMVQSTLDLQTSQLSVAPKHEG